MTTIRYQIAVGTIVVIQHLSPSQRVRESEKRYAMVRNLQSVISLGVP